MVHLNMTKDPTPKEGLIRHMVLNSLRMYRMKFGSDYGELVLCADDRNYWRKEIFPFYKQNRKRDQQKSPHDWNEIFTALNVIKAELKTFFPYKMIQVEHAEADDVIAAICHKYGETQDTMTFIGSKPEPILIISGDKDLCQLQKYVNVKSYSPVLKKWLNITDPKKYLYEHILRGDRSDGVPNFLSQDSSFMSGGRQKPIQTKKINVWLELEPEDFCNENMLRGFKRNEQLIDLDLVPAEIQEEALRQFKMNPEGDRSNLLNYFIHNNLNKLIEAIQEF